MINVIVNFKRNRLALVLLTAATIGLFSTESLAAGVPVLYAQNADSQATFAEPQIRIYNEGNSELDLNGYLIGICVV